MTATNHALTGAVIGVTIGNPIIAIPLAFASHFIVDLIPHFGIVNLVGGLGSKLFRAWLICDVLLCIVLVAILWRWHATNWLLACVCAFVATSPDFMWAKKFFDAQAGKKIRQPRYLLARIHNEIQYERPAGLVVELAWSILCIGLLTSLLVIR